MDCKGTDKPEKMTPRTLGPEKFVEAMGLEPTNLLTARRFWVIFGSSV
jgi:hypothetical protein